MSLIHLSSYFESENHLIPETTTEEGECEVEMNQLSTGNGGDMP